MRKLVCCLTLVVVTLTLSAQISMAEKYSGYFGVDQIVEISGGNNNVKVQEPPLAIAADLDDLSDENSESFNLINPHDKNDPIMTYARNVQRIYKGGNMGSVVYLNGKFSSKPVNNSVPKEKDGLLNLKNPVVIVSNHDSMVIWLEQQKYEDMYEYELRILDSNGNVIGEKVTYDNNKVSIKLSTKPQNYYVEFSWRPGNKKRQYCYTLLNMRNGGLKPELTASELKFATSVIDDYMKRNGISSYDAITQEQDGRIFLLFAHIRMLEVATAEDKNLVPNYLKEHNMTYSQIRRQHYMEMMDKFSKNKKATLDDYMQRSGKTYDTFTDEDAMNMAKEQMSRTQNNCSNAQVMALLQDYMKKHGIKRLEDLTEKDLKNFEAEAKKMYSAPAKGKKGKKK